MHQALSKKGLGEYLMKNLKALMIVFTLTFFCLVLSSPAALAANIAIDKQAGTSAPGFFHTPDYATDSACIQAALDSSKSGDTITIRAGTYNITEEIYQANKSLNIIGDGEVTLDIQTPDRGVLKILNQEIFFNGTLVTGQNLSSSAKKGTSKVVLPDASQVSQNDLIKIWKNVQWCPLDYPGQMTGEIYVVKSVNGNVLTLNQPLFRDYNLSETPQVEVYRPIQMHIKNIRVQDTGSTMLHHGLVLQYCKDSSVTDSWFNNSGFGAVCLYSCFNVSVKNNEMYNSLRPNCGYGINVASGSAFVKIENNHIENCRHAITGNSDELRSLNRDVFIANNTLIGANVTGAGVIDAHAVTIDYAVTRNRIYPQLPYYCAFLDGTQKSTFYNNEIFGGSGGIFKRGNLSDGVHIYENNSFNGMSGVMYLGGIKGIDSTLIIRNNTQNNGTYGVYFLAQGSSRNIIISGNTFSNLSYHGVYEKFPVNGINLNISNNIFANIKLNGIYIDGNSFTGGVVKVQNNTLINVNTSNSPSGIIVKNIQNAVISGNQILKVPVAAFSASSTSGYSPLTVNFTDNSTGTQTSCKWSFGDGTSSTQKNPSHTYSKAGNYTVTLTVSNAAGSNAITKASYISVRTATNATKPVVSFWGSKTSGTAPVTIGFTDASTNMPTAWNWNFGDGTSSTEKNPKHTYTKAGNYTVTLTASNAAGSTTRTRANYIKLVSVVQKPSAVQKPVASFTSNITSGKLPLNVAFTDKSTGTPTSWRWSFGDRTYSTQKNPVHRYTKAGKFTVSLRVNNAAGNNTTTKIAYIKI